jgi:hypothetical protein
MPTYATRAPSQRATPCRCGGAGCAACRELATPCRPRYFAGQLLTEAELAGAQAYVLEKHRLHNRYLHGSGIVCGLEVTCDDCAGWVTVAPGYAIDPCGNDVVVPQAAPFPLLERIAECRAGDRPDVDCSPLRKPDPADCADEEETWCITLAYREQDAEPVAALRREHAAGRVCTCGGGNGNGNRNGNGCGCSGTPKLPVAQCEPTRTCECYVLGLARSESPPPDGDKMPWEVDVEHALEGTLLARAAECVTQILKVLAQRVSADAGRRLYVRHVVGGEGIGDLEQGAADLRRLHVAVRELYETTDDDVRCDVFAQLAALRERPPEEDREAEFRAQAREGQILASLVAQRVLDCICAALLPPCPPDPADPRLVLACVTVRGGTIVRICNLAGRRHAGAFPSARHWLSLVPVLPLVRAVAGALCCEDWASPTPDGQTRLMAALDRVDGSGQLRRAVLGADPLVGHVMNKLAATPGRIRGGVAVARLVGRPLGDVRTELDEHGVAVVVREVEEAGRPPEHAGLRAPVLAMPGQALTAFVDRDGTVTAMDAFDTGEEVAERRAETDRLAREVAALRKEITALKRRR